MNEKETIAAIATPAGIGGIGIIRVSGEKSLETALLFFRGKREGKKILPYRLHYGWVRDKQGQKIDEVLLAYMPGPASYTGEDVVELHCHGNPLLLQTVLDLLLGAGCRLATNGEFTKRAFLNGRLDLTQAGAVGELMAGEGGGGVQIALNVLQGYLGTKVSELRAGLEKIKAGFCLAVDFPEEDIDIPPLADFVPDLKKIRADIDTLLQGYERNRPQREGALVVLAGRVNAGKSSLLNAFLGRDRAIVTDVPGTTRDYLEENIHLGGLLVRLVDTAGTRQTQDEVESAGIRRSLELVRKADLVLLLIDGQGGPDREDEALLQSLSADKILVVATKKDRVNHLPDWVDILRAVFISSWSGEGIAELEKAISQRLIRTEAATEMNFSPNLRQRNLLLQAREELAGLEHDCASGVSYDLAGVGLDMVISRLMEVTGEISSEETLSAIFSQFCIGK